MPPWLSCDAPLWLLGPMAGRPHYGCVPFLVQQHESSAWRVRMQIAATQKRQLRQHARTQRLQRGGAAVAAVGLLLLGGVALGLFTFGRLTFVVQMLLNCAMWAALLLCIGLYVFFLV